MSTNFAPTNARDAGFRMPAEWEPHSGCWMAWPDSLAVWDRHLLNAQQDYARVANAIADFEPVRMLVPPRAAAQALDSCTKAVEIIPWELKSI